MPNSQPAQQIAPPPTAASLDDPRHASPSIWQLAWPTVLTNLLQSTVALTDVKVVGTLGAAAIAAATTGHRMFFVLQAVLMGVSIGTGALVARAWGAGKREEAAHVLRSSLGLGCVLALAMGVFGVACARPFVDIFGLDPSATELAVIYTRWISSFSLVFAIGFVFSAALRAAGDTRTPLWIGAIANLANILFLYLLVYGGLGFPKLGIKGAALAGGLAFATSAIVSLLLWQSGRLSLPRLRADSQAEQRMRAVLRVGYPAALEQLIVQAGFIAFTFIVARRYGTDALAAYGIGVQILSLSFVVGFGFSIAASTLVGQHLGADRPEAAAHSGWRATQFAVGSMSLLALLLIGCARPIAEFMINDPAVVKLTVSFMYFLGAAQPLMAIEYGLGGALRGAGDTRYPLLCTISGLIGGRVLWAALVALCGLPVQWVYATLLIDYSVKAVMLVSRFRSRKWQRVLA